MPLLAPPPSCCAGLRQTLLHGWQEDFPLHPSPFHQMAARSGATPRELLKLCMSMQRSGALQPVRPRWGAAMQRGHWRLGFDGTPSAGAIATALGALPGCLRIERGEADESRDGVPAVWAEFEALDENALQGQLARLPAPASARLRLPAPGAMLACDDPALAASVERGLPLCANPFAEVARQLGCSEHRVLATLAAWRRSGQLAGLMLKPLQPRTSTPGMLLLWRQLPADAATLAALQDRQGVDRLIVAPGSARWPWQLTVVLRTLAQFGAAQAREWLAQAALGAPPDHALPLHVERPRDEALLFNPG